MLSKQINKLNRSLNKYLNTSSIQSSEDKLNPWFVTGLLDAESSFTVLIVKDSKRKLGWRVECKFQLGLH